MIATSFSMRLLMLGLLLSICFAGPVFAQSAPTVANPIPDQNWSGSGVKSLVIANNVFADSDNDSLTYSASGMPTGITFTALTRAFSGNPTTAMIGNHTITVTANDGNGGTVSDQFTLAIATPNDAPTVANAIPDQSWSGSGSQSFVFAANVFADEDTGDTFTYSASGMPAGITFTASTRTFSGNSTTTMIGNHAITVTADDGHGGTVSDQFTLAIVTPNDAPTVANAIPDQSWSGNGSKSFAFASDVFADADGDNLTYSTSGMPAGITFTASTRTFSGNPTVAMVGDHAITVTANDSNGGTVSDQFTLTIVTPNDAPTVAHAIPDQSWTGNGNKTFTFASDVFADADVGDVLAYAASGMPAGVTFDGPGRTFSGNPPRSLDGQSFTVTVTAQDGNGGAVQDVFRLSINDSNDPPSVANPIPDHAWNGSGPQEFIFAATTFSDLDDDALTYAANGLPVGVSFDPAARRFHGNPAVTVIGDHVITVTADDGHGGSVTDSFVLAIATPNDAPVVSNAIPDRAWTGAGIVTWTVAANAFSDPDGEGLAYAAIGMPAGMTFDAATRTFSGNLPRGMNGQSFTITVTASDGNGGTVDDAFLLSIVDVNDPPSVVVAISDQSWDGNGSHEYIVAEDAFGDVDGDVLTCSATGMPTGVVFDPATRRFSGNPSSMVQGGHAITVTASDGHGGTNTDTFILTITNANDAPVVAAAIPDQSWSGRGTKTFTFASDAFADADLDSLTYAASGFPARITFDGPTRTFSGNPRASDAGDHEITVTVDDGHGGTAQDAFILHIGDTNDAPVLDDAKTPLMAAVLEDAASPAAGDVVGTMVADLIAFGGGLANVADDDDGSVTGMAVVGLAGTGIWHFSVDGGAHWTAFTASASSARLLAADALTRIVYQPAADEHDATNGGTPAITFHAWDGTSGVNGDMADLSGAGATGGITAFSDQTDAAQAPVTAVNDAPRFTIGPDQTILEDAGPQHIAAWATGILPGGNGIHAEIGQTMQFQVVGNTAPGLFSVAPVVAADGTLTYTPAADANGQATITIRIKDDGGTAHGGDDTSDDQAFVITMHPVNDAPTFVIGGNQIVEEDAGPISVPAWIAGHGPGGGTFRESSQVLHFEVVGNDRSDLFAAQPTISPDGVLTFTTAPNANGVATVSLRLVDDGGVAEGGVDASAVQTFTITLTPVDDAPTLTWHSSALGRDMVAADADKGAVTVAGDLALNETHDINGGTTSLLIDRVSRWTMQFEDPDVGDQATANQYDRLTITVSGRGATRTGDQYTVRDLKRSVGHALLLQLRQDSGLVIERTATNGLPWAIRARKQDLSLGDIIAGYSGMQEVIAGTESLQIRFTSGLSAVAGDAAYFGASQVDSEGERAANAQNLVERVLRALGYINLYGAQEADADEPFGLFGINLAIPGSQDGLSIHRLLAFQLNNTAPTLTAGTLRVRPGQFQVFTVSTSSDTPVININDDTLGSSAQDSYVFQVVAMTSTGKVVNKADVDVEIASFTLAQLAAGDIGYITSSQNQTSDLIGLTVTDPGDRVSDRANLSININLLDFTVPQVVGDPVPFGRVPVSGSEELRALSIEQPKEWSLPYALVYRPEGGGTDPHLSVVHEHGRWRLMVTAHPAGAVPRMATGRVVIVDQGNAATEYSSWPVMLLLVGSGPSSSSVAQ